MKNITSTLYPHQLKAFLATKSNDKGKVLMPTGTGKTYVQAAVIAEDILENPGFSMYLLNAPRIMLSYQLLQEVYGFNVRYGIDCEYMMIHSGDAPSIKELEQIRALNDSEILFTEINSSTSKDAIQDKIRTCQKNNRPIVFVSTYHSADKLYEAKKGMRNSKVSVMLNDEAQYLVEERFFPIADMDAKRKYFFTATEKTTVAKEGRGMNNTKTYGETIYNMTPYDAINKGLMLRPRMHFVTNANNAIINTREDVQNSLGTIVQESYKQHAYSLNGVTPKMLIAASGTKDIKTIIESSNIERLMAVGVNVYAVSSNEGIQNWINGEYFTRQEFLRRLKEDGKNPNSRMIIIHYDILTEGIDTSGITGVLFLRGMNQTKFMQTYGRAARLNDYDRNAIHEKKTIDPSSPESIKNMLKPYAWVIVPVLTMDEEEDATHIAGMVQNLRDYGFNPSEDIIISDPKNGIPPQTGLDGMNELQRRSQRTFEAIQNVQAQIEDEEFAASLNEASALELLSLIG